MSHSESHRRLGDFEITREIGRGGMGVVYEARQVSLNRKVALKVLSGGLGLTPKAVQRFRREAEAAAKLHHTNIVPVYATGEEEGTHFYAMELIDGPSLDHVIRLLKASGGRQPPGPESLAERKDRGDDAHRSPELEATGPYVAEPGRISTLSASSLSSDGHYFDTVARMVAEVADALEYAHEQGVIHRDIKPSNLLLSPAGRLSINDFGLARMLEQPGMTLTGEFVGTPAYMSPEQITAGRAPLNHRTDIYSLGATLYELLTLQRPFLGERRDEVIAQIMHKEPKPPRRINRRVPIDLETICMKALEKDPDRRYQTAGAMAEDLRRYVNRFAISARRVGPVGRLVKWVRRRPALAAALACVAVAVSVAAFFAHAAYKSEQQRRDEVRTIQRENALEKALAAAMGGDLEKAESAISEAEGLGSSPAQAHMVRGLVAFNRGDHGRALAELEDAVKAEPDSVAARGILSMLYLKLDDSHRHVQAWKELENLPLHTPEDYLFKGFAQVYVDPKQAIQNLNVAVARRNSPLARAIRADILLTRLEDQGDPEDARLAVDDLLAAKAYLPDNTYVISIGVWVHVVTANFYLETGKPEQQRAALELAEREAKALKSRDTLIHPFRSLWVYYEQTNDEPACFDLAERAYKNSDASLFTYHYALALHRRGQSAKALELLNRKNWNGFAADYLRVCVVAENHPEDRDLARKACEEMAKHYESEDLRPELLYLLGYNEDARAASRAIRQKLPPSSDVESKYRWDYFCGDIPASEYLNACGRSKWARSGAHYHIALARLAEKDRDGARDHFRQGVETRLIVLYNVDWCRSFLARMEKDPKWPPWIHLKK
jgi:hypothetical protein